MDWRADNTAIPEPRSKGNWNFANPIVDGVELQLRLPIMRNRIWECPNETQCSVETLVLRLPKGCTADTRKSHALRSPTMRGLDRICLC